MSILSWIGAAIVAVITAGNHPNTVTVIPPAQPKPVDLFADHQLLKRICSCESQGRPDVEPRQFDQDGNIILGVPNADDVGACQINLPTWSKTAKKLKLDPFLFEGNVKLATWISENDPRHFENWEWSKSCWKIK